MAKKFELKLVDEYGHVLIDRNINYEEACEVARIFDDAPDVSDEMIQKWYDELHKVNPEKAERMMRQANLGLIKRSEFASLLALHVTFNEELENNG